MKEYAVLIKFKSTGGAWSKPYTYKSHEPVNAGDVAVVPQYDFFAVGQVVSCHDVYKFNPDIEYKFIKCIV